MKLFDLCERWFISEGYLTSRPLPSILRVKYQGINLLIHQDKSDDLFFKMDAIYPMDQFKGTRVDFLRAASDLNKKRKIVKAYIDDDNIVITTEVLFDQTPQVGDILPRLLSMITQAMPYFVERL